MAQIYSRVLQGPHRLVPVRADRAGRPPSSPARRLPVFWSTPAGRVGPGRDVRCSSCAAVTAVTVVPVRGRSAIGLGRRLRRVRGRRA